MIIIAETSVISPSNKNYDTIILVTPGLEYLTGDLLSFETDIKVQAEIDEELLKIGGIVRINSHAFIKRLIYAPTGPLNRDYDDVRRFGDAGVAAIKRGLKSGMKAPLVAVIVTEKFKLSARVAYLGILQALYVPLEIVEYKKDEGRKIQLLGFIADDVTVKIVSSFEDGRVVARDIGGSDPERMAPPKVQEYVMNTFGNNSPILVNTISEDKQLLLEYPLFSAVNRCAKGVTRHQGRVIYLNYTGSGKIDRTLLLVGKGVTYDTGGADIKAGGVMASMHRDKCGAAAVAGFMNVLDRLRPKNLKVIAGMAMVRNSVGSDCYVSDEIITARSGARIRIGNTDAEGRMAMADVLCVMKELAVNEVNPCLMTIATLTGHCVLAYGENYTAIMENGPAKLQNIASTIQIAGDEIGDPFEISTIRREDYVYHEGKSEYEDLLQCGNEPSTKSNRGHQGPAAFLIMASGLDKYGKDSSQPLPYCHVDIAGSSGPFPGVPTGTPVLALARAFGLDQHL